MSNALKTSRFAGIAFTMVFSSANACVSPPAEQRAPIDVLIAGANTIVLARATSASITGSFEATDVLQPIRQISGVPIAKLEIAGYPRTKWTKGRMEWNFHDHSDEVFWKDDWAARVTNSVDCELHPSFTIGGTYLVFLSQVPHIKGFERIENQSTDKSLKYVESKVLRQH
ncbi:MAG: hypothetical protein ABWZ08_05570 [Pseudoxanthomonas sp.]